MRAHGTFREGFHRRIEIARGEVQDQELDAAVLAHRVVARVDDWIGGAACKKHAERNRGNPI
jgi:hypothetical protein